MLEQLDIHMQKKKISQHTPLQQDLTPFTKINPQWITDLNVKHKMMKLLEDNIGENLDDLHYSNEFLDNKTKGMVHERNNW